jgi:hypothetical protein
MANWQHVYFLLMGVHYLCDFPLQTHAIAHEKSRHSKTDLQKHVPWPYWLTAHAAVHGLGVALVTGSAFLGLLEMIAHWLIDLGKCEKWYSIHVDQTLHALCKFAWVLVYINMTMR